MKCVSFSQKPDELSPVTPHSQIYGCHPSTVKASKAGLVKVGPHTDPYTSKNGEVMAARAAKRNSDERKAELKKAQIRRRQVIEEYNHCILDQGRQKDRDQRVLRQLVTIEDVDHARAPCDP